LQIFIYSFIYLLYVYLYKTKQDLPLFFSEDVSTPWTGFELQTLVAIGTDCTGSSSCKSNYHMITTTTASTAPIDIQYTVDIIFHVYKQSEFSSCAKIKNWLGENTSPKKIRLNGGSLKIGKIHRHDIERVLSLDSNNSSL
jgi:hypothetical protein